MLASRETLLLRHGWWAVLWTVACTGSTQPAGSVGMEPEGGVLAPAGPSPEDAIAAIEQDVAGVVSGSLSERMTVHDTPGVSVAVVDDGAIAWAHAWGVYDLVNQTALEPDSPLQAASLSKPTTAIGLMRLVEDGRATLDGPLDSSLTAWRIPESPLARDAPVTLQRVLSHTAGFNLDGFLGYEASSPVPTLVEVLEGAPPARNEPLQVISVPGTQWRYSGGGYTALAQVVVDVTGQPFEDWMESNVLRPFGMADSTFAQPNDDPEVATASIASLFGNPVRPFVYPELSAAGLWSTAPDLARLILGFQEALADGSSVLSQGSAQAMVTPQTPSPTAADLGLLGGPRIGLGFFLLGGDDPGWFWHTGGNVGFTCLIVGDVRGRGQGVVVMTNSFPGGRLLAWEIANAVATLYEWPEWSGAGL